VRGIAACGAREGAGRGTVAVIGTADQAVARLAAARSPASGGPRDWMGVVQAG